MGPGQSLYSAADALFDLDWFRLAPPATASRAPTHTPVYLEAPRFHEVMRARARHTTAPMAASDVPSEKPSST